MKRSISRIVLVAVGFVTTGITFITACADTGSATSEGEDASNALPNTSPDAGDDDASNADCETSASCDPSSVDCSTTDFCPAAIPVPTSVCLNAVWGSGADDVWIVGTRGTILHGDGTSFVRMPSGTDAVFFSVWGTDPEDVWVAESRAPLHSTPLADGGLDWAPVRGDGWQDWAENDGRTWVVRATAKNEVWMAGAPSARFGNGSASIWRTDPTGEDAVVWVPEAIYKSGSEATQAPTIRALGGSGPDDFWAVGSSWAGTTRGEIFHYEPPLDGRPGRWTDRNSNTQLSLESIWAASASDVWAVGEGGVIRHLANGSSPSFDIVASPTTRTLHGLWGSGPNDVWAVGDQGTVIHWDGQSWRLASAGFSQGSHPNLYGVWGTGPDDVWIAGDGIVLHRTKDSRRHP